MAGFPSNRPTLGGASRRGQAGLFVVVSLTVMFAALGLAIDLGLGYGNENNARGAADAASLAAAAWAQNNGYTCGTGGVVCGTLTCANPATTPATNNLQAGCLYAQANGFVTGNGKTVTLSGSDTAPPGALGSTLTYWTRANISTSNPTLFARFGGVETLNVNASSAAGVTVSPPRGCIYLLASTGAKALYLDGSSSLTSTCGIFVNSSAARAVWVGGSSHLNGTQILINGGTAYVEGSSTISPAANTNGGPVTDPLSSLPMPAFSGCDRTNYFYGISGTPTTIGPGVYCGGIRIDGSSRVTMTPGLYVLNGGGMVIGGSSTVTANGVTFFNTGQGGRTPAPISFDGSSMLTMSAPSSGTYMGMLLMQDRNISYSGMNGILGSSNSSFTGTLYFPSTNVMYDGSSIGTYTAIIAKTLTLSSSSYVKNDPTGSHTGLAQRFSSLIQ